MIPKFSTSSCLSFRSVLYADSAFKSPFQLLIQNVLGTTRQIWRDLFKSPVVVPKFQSVTYRPGIIYKVTSRWSTNSQTGVQRADLLRRFYRGGSGPLIGFVGFALAKKPSLLSEDEELEGVSYLIRDSFSSLHWKGEGLNVDKLRTLSKITLADLKFGKFIAKGCNAAIYCAHLHKSNGVDSAECGKQSHNILNKDEIMIKEKNDVEPLEHDIHLSKVLKNNETNHIDKNDVMMSIEKNELKETDSQFFIPHSEREHSPNSNSVHKNDLSLQTGSFGNYDIAVKVMFNYNAESNAYAIWNEMYKETLPSISEFSFGDAWNHKVRKKRLKPHPNIVKMYCAFADQLPLLPDAVKSHPIALPPRLLSDGCGRNMTLFLVMKRYNCNLKQYLQSNNISSETALLLLTQLLEALVHLFQNGITHRDLKSDNILLDLSQGNSSPKLSVTDFGCCLENLFLLYSSHEIPKGGNVCLMAPEVVNAKPGPFSVIDYSRADIWAAGAIAYEIFGAPNPFYVESNYGKAISQVKLALLSNSYEEKDLPPLPAKAPHVIQKLVKSMLCNNPKQRPSQSFAATVCQILINAPSSLLINSSDVQNHKKALKWMFQLSAQTYLEVSLTKESELPVKLELCRTFCSRVQYLEVLKALEYIFEN